MNINQILEMNKKNSEQFIEYSYKITYISAAIYPRFHTHLLSKLVPKLNSRIRSIIVLIDTQII